MKKLRYYLAIFVLAITTLGGPIFLQEMGAMANTASSWHASSHFAAEQSARSVASKPYGQCIGGGGYDC